MTFNPFSWDYHTWRLIFAIAAGWSLLVALPGLFAPRFALRTFWSNDSLRTAPAVKQWLLNALMVLLGGCYLLIAWQPESFLWLVAMGSTVKFGFAISLLIHHFGGRNSDRMAVVALLDFIMAVFFLLYLIGGERIPI